MSTSRSIQAFRLLDGSPRSHAKAVDNFSTDQQLLDWLRSGDERAIERIYAEYGRVVFGLLIRLLGDRGEAEDVQQKVFTEVWRRGGDYDPDRGGLLTWIMQIARSRAVDSLRKRRPEPVDPATGLPTESLADDGFVDELNDQWQVAYLLDRLPREEAEMLRARFYLGKSQTEIADERGVALGTVKMRMVDGLRRMREMLDEEGALK